jgi:hypothetical protein
MYIEDLVVYAKSFIGDKDYYSEFLRPSTLDLGAVIYCFFENIERLSDNDILKIMSWVDLSLINLDDQLEKPLKLIIDYNITKVRKLLTQLKDFGKSNHPIYKRFKHGGMPVVSDAIQKIPKSGDLAILKRSQLFL